MYDYMRALEDRFNSKPSYEQRQQLEAMRQEVLGPAGQGGAEEAPSVGGRPHPGTRGRIAGQLYRRLPSSLGV